MAQTLTEARARCMEDRHNQYTSADHVATGKHVVCLSRNEYGTWIPWMAVLVKRHTSGKVTVRLGDKGQCGSKTVSAAAILHGVSCTEYDAD